MGCNCKKPGGSMRPAPKPKDTSKDSAKPVEKDKETK